ncbi:hypothetical protein T265_15110, partial [Opisthorchis viverrini]
MTEDVPADYLVNAMQKIAVEEDGDTAPLSPPSPVPFEVGQFRRSEMLAYCTGKNRCLESKFRQTLLRYYRGHKQRVEKIDQGQSEIAAHLYRAYKARRTQQRKTRDELREIYGQSEWFHKFTEQTKKKAEEPESNAPKLPPVDVSLKSDDEARKRVKFTDKLRHSRSNTENKKERNKEPIPQESTFAVLLIEPHSFSPVQGIEIVFPKEVNDTQRSVTDWLSVAETTQPEIVATYPDDEGSHLPAGVEKSHPPFRSTGSLQTKYPNRHMAQVQEALAEEPRAYVWVGDKHQLICPVGRTAVRTDLVLRETSFPKPAHIRLLLPDSRQKYVNKKMCDQEFERLNESILKTKPFLERLETLKI